MNESKMIVEIVKNDQHDIRSLLSTSTPKETGKSKGKSKGHIQREKIE